MRALEGQWIGKYAKYRAATSTPLEVVLDGDATMASHATSIPAQVYRLFIKATPERIWEAITKPEFTSRYYFGAQVEAELVPGGRFVYHSSDRSSLLVDGTVVEADPPRRLVTTRRPLRLREAGEPPTRVTFEIEAQPEGYCGLTLTRDELQGGPEAATGAQRNWPLVLSGLKTLLETGEPLACR